MMEFGFQKRQLRARAGFTLVELMVVVAIIGILAGLAGPTYRTHLYKSYRVEAQRALRTIWLQQSSFFAEHGFYAGTFDEIGFAPPGGIRLDPQTVQGRRYTYSLTSLVLDGNENGNFRATAAGDLDGSDPMLDILIIENQLTLQDG